MEELQARASSSGSIADAMTDDIALLDALFTSFTGTQYSGTAEKFEMERDGNLFL